MKTAYTTNSEILHLWANQAQNHAPSLNVSFEGRRLLSYQTVIAELCPDRHGQLLAVFDEAWHSVSTAKHLTHARQAASHLPSVSVSRGQRGQRSIMPCIGDALMLINRAAKALSGSTCGPILGRPAKIEQAVKNVARALELADRFSLGALTVPNELSALNLTNAIVAASKEAQKWHAKRNSPEALAKRASLKQAKEAAEAALRNERIEAWKRGEVNSCSSPVILLRMARGEDHPTVETSHGARVRLHDALRFFHLCRKAKDAGLGFEPQGDFKVGPYALNKIEANGTAHVGCHVLSFDEMERLHEVIADEVDKVNTKLGAY